MDGQRATRRRYESHTGTWYLVPGYHSLRFRGFVLYTGTWKRLFFGPPSRVSKPCRRQNGHTYIRCNNRSRLRYFFARPCGWFLWAVTKKVIHSRLVGLSSVVGGTWGVPGLFHVLLRVRASRFESSCVPRKASCVMYERCYGVIWRGCIIGLSNGQELLLGSLLSVLPLSPPCIFIWYLKVASTDDDGLVLVLEGFGRGHEEHVLMLLGASAKPPSRLARCLRTLNIGSLGRSRGRPFTSDCVRSLCSRTPSILKINDGGSHIPDVG